MSEVIDNLNKANEKVAAKASDLPEVKGMGISDMKDQILEKLKKKQALRAVIESPKPVISREEMLEAVKNPADIRRVSGLPEESEKLKAELARKDAVIQDLEKSLKAERDRAAIAVEMARARDKRIAEAEKLSGGPDKARKISEEERARYESLQDEHKKAALGRDEAAKLLKILRAEVDIKERSIHSLQKKVERLDELEEMLQVHDKQTIEARILKELEDAKRLNEEYRVKLDSSRSNVSISGNGFDAEADEIKKQAAKITQVEEASKNKDRKILEMSELRVTLEAEKAELESKLRAAENDNRSLSEKFRKEQEASSGDTLSQLQASLRGNRELESKLEQTRLELGAKTTRLAEADKLYKELDLSVRELTAKLQENQRRMKELEASGEGLALRLANAERDNKAGETRISGLSSEVEAKTARLESAEKINKELESMIKDSEFKLQTSQRKVGELEKEIAEVGIVKNNLKQIEKSDLELKNTIERLESEIETRDSKIGSDMKYTEKIVRELGELRKKLAARDGSPDRTKSADA
jgi:hypothetical protein